MKKQPFFFYYIYLTIIFFAACKKSKDGFETTESGLKYKFITSVEGKKPAIGDRMLMHILYKTDFDSVLFDSKIKGDSFTVLLVEPTFRGGVEEGFAMMSAGDSAIFKTSADSVFEVTFHSQLPPYLKKGDFLLFQVKMKSIIDQAVYDSLQRALDIELRKQEFARIDTFMEINKMDIMPTENGAYVSITNPGSGPLPAKGDTMFVTYSGMLLNGKIFDQSLDKKKPFTFVLGKNMVIPGWEEAMPMLQK
jgi:FKBP-type peptidyl-prolyl cis-trans isomerase FkpA